MAKPMSPKEKAFERKDKALDIKQGVQEGSKADKAKDKDKSTIKKY